MINQIKVNNIKKVYKNKVVAIEQMNAEFEAGKFYAVMGPSGSGKSTLLNMIGTLDSITDGSIYYDERDIGKMGEKEKTLLRKNKIGFIFQGFYLNPYLTARENVEVPLKLNEHISAKERKQKAEELLETFGLLDRKNHFPEEMSGGEQQRVCMARAMANQPDVILADEPTGNLDSENEKIVFEQLKKLSKQEKIVIVVSHNEIVRQYADEIIEMKKAVTS